MTDLFGAGVLGWIALVGLVAVWFGLVGLVVCGICAIRARRERVAPSTPLGWDSDVGTLRERFAQGKITANEYQRARTMLNSNTHRAPPPFSDEADVP